MGHLVVAASHHPHDIDVVKSVEPADYEEVLHHVETAPSENAAAHVIQCLLTCRKQDDQAI